MEAITIWPSPPMAKLPLDRLEPKQRFQVKAFINKDEIVNRIMVKQFLNSLS